jgi:hypothetical protein
MNVLALIPAIVATIVSWRMSPARAFIVVYLPSLLLVPDYYRWLAPGLPDPNFHQSAILAIAAMYFIQERKWKFSPLDIPILGLAGSMGISQYVATGYADAQNLAFTMLCSVVLPYLLAKSILQDPVVRTDFAKALVLLLALVALASVFEFRFIRNPFQDFLRPFFPGLGYGWVTNIRWGFGRIAGPYGHSILAGIMFAVGYRVHRWLQDGGHWGSSKSDRIRVFLVTVSLLGGALMTLSRGPWIGAVLGGCVALLGTVKNRNRTALIMVLSGVFLAGPCYLLFKSYVSVDRDQVQSLTQETAAYRKELFEKYVDIAFQRKAWGWGQNTIPKIPGLDSVDNYWLLLALMHGLIALGSFTAIFTIVMSRLAQYGFRTRPSSEESRTAFTLVGIFVVFAFSITTVYLGTQTQPLLFLMAGWADGFLNSRENSWSEDQLQLPPPVFHFKRVLC